MIAHNGWGICEVRGEAEHLSGRPARCGAVYPLVTCPDRGRSGRNERRVIEKREITVELTILGYQIKIFNLFQSSFDCNCYVKFI